MLEPVGRDVGDAIQQRLKSAQSGALPRLIRSEYHVQRLLLRRKVEVQLGKRPEGEQLQLKDLHGASSLESKRARRRCLTSAIACRRISGLSRSMASSPVRSSGGSLRCRSRNSPDRAERSCSSASRSRISRKSAPSGSSRLSICSKFTSVWVCILTCSIHRVPPLTSVAAARISLVHRS